MEDLFSLSQTQIALFNRSYRRYFLKRHELDRRLCVVLGQRGVGKTTAMVQHLLDSAGGDRLSESILYVQSDHFLIQNRSLYEIAEWFVNMGGKTICFDEIHKYQRWSMELKSMTDTFAGLNVLATGSSALEIYRGSHDLSRRALQLKMWGMSFREYIELETGVALSSFRLEDILENHVRIAFETTEKLGDKKILALFKAYLRHGYYPFYFEDRDENVFFQLLNQNLHTVVESDLLAVNPSFTGNSVKKLTKLFAVISESVPFTPNFKELTRLVEVGDQRTLKTYLKYLEDAGLILGIGRFGKGLGSLEKPEIIYLNNPNLIYALAPFANIGTIQEVFFLNMLGALHTVKSSPKGDFFVDDTYLFEIGGKKKGFSQIRDVENSYLALDDMERGFGKKIPLWLLGFLY